MEGHLPCLKFLIASAPSPTHITGARNDQGETPKMLAQQFYKEEIVDYINNIEWERDHPETGESKKIREKISSNLIRSEKSHPGNKSTVQGCKV
jgi:ankyrin repeat domain-containing protein 42